MKVLVMTPKRDRHWDEEELENYSRGILPEEEAGQVEEHLLTCEPCRRQLSQTEAYIASIRRAGARLRAEESSPRELGWFPRFGPVMAAALALLVAVVAFRAWKPGAGAPVAVTLTATRGASGPAQAPTDRPLRLQPVLQGLPALPSYRIEMVDPAGRRLWQGDLRPAGGPGIIAPAPPAGLYFVRVYTPSGTLLREYALAVGAVR